MMIKINKDEMGMACSTQGINQKCLKSDKLAINPKKEEGLGRPTRRCLR
jgi:hypothetical protein